MPARARAGFDAHMMAIALRLAMRGLGCTAPNPSVGAVVVDEAAGEVIARAVTALGGRPHAETIALARAGPRARGATLYVTLEPCSHHGITAPCADAIVAAGIARVVCAIEDPDPRVGGRGLERLRAAGIRVERGLMAEPAHAVALGHILRLTERRPFVELKLALGADGEVPRGNSGAPAWATGPAARAYGYLLRARVDAILVGRRTVIDDDPMLTCRLPGLEDRSPVRVVLGGEVRGLERSKLVGSARRVPLWIVCPPGADAAALKEAGARIIEAERVGGELWLPGVMEALVASGITRLLVEGGPVTWRAFAQAGLVDEAVLFQARRVQGAPLATAVAADTLDRYLGSINLALFEHRTVGSDDMMVFRRPWHPKGATRDIEGGTLADQSKQKG